MTVCYMLVLPLDFWYLLMQNFLLFPSVMILSFCWVNISISFKSNNNFFFDSGCLWCTFNIFLKSLHKYFCCFMKCETLSHLHRSPILLLGDIHFYLHIVANDFWRHSLQASSFSLLERDINKLQCGVYLQ